MKAKAYELAKFCNADVYLFVNHQRGSFVYNSVHDRFAELGKLISFGFQCLGSPYEFDSGVPVGIRATHGFQI
jgi:hypothetical protein